jgi:hypothetical protein
MTDELRRAMEPWKTREWDDGCGLLASRSIAIEDRATLQQAVREREEQIKRLREALTEIAEITFVNDEGDKSILEQPAQCNKIARAILAELPEDAP